MSSPVLAAIVLTASSVLAGTATAIYDFDRGNADTTDFHTAHSCAPVAQQSRGGLAGSGSLDVTTADGTQAWFSSVSYASKITEIDNHTMTSNGTIASVVPEPTGAMMFGLAGMTLLLRRRHA